MLLRRIARPLLAAGFLAEGAGTLQNPRPLAEALRPILSRDGHVPGAPTENPENAARLVACAEIGSAAMLAMGKAPRAAAAVLATISAVGLGAHPFWSEVDRDLKRKELGDFIGGVSRLGALLIVTADTEGKPSLRWRSEHAAEDVRDRGTDFAETARERGADLLETVRDKAAALTHH